jgi:hypothetical protein
MKIALCSPLSNSEPVFRKCFDDLIYVLESQGVEVKCFHTYGVSGIVRVRNEITEKALAWEPDYLFWVDDDMAFNNDIVEKLLSHKKDFVCGLMFNKTPPFIPTIKKVSSEGVLGFTNYVDYPKNTLIEIAGCGFAAVLIHRRIFEDLMFRDINGPQWFAENQLDIGESEDINFCIRARKKDHKIWCDTSVKTRHIGGYGIGEENFDYWFNKMGGRVEHLWD